MNPPSSSASAGAPDDTYRLIWNRMRERENRLSSVWWFFLLFPRDGGRFSRRQMMFMLGSKRGVYQVDGAQVSARAEPSAAALCGDAADTFPCFSLGWIHDGRRLHDSVVRRICLATLDPSGHLAARTDDRAHSEPAIELVKGGSRPFEMRARFDGSGGHARFSAWGDAGSAATSPVVSIDLNTPLGGGHVIGWERLAFEGEFGVGDAVETLEGVGFFQRVCANAPWMPWKWIYVVFDDESIFSCFMPYVGPHLFRRSRRFFPQRFESLTFEPLRMAQFVRGGTKEVIHFDRVHAEPRLAGGALPQFDVSCRSTGGDHLRLVLDSYDHTGYTLSRPIAGDMLTSRYLYNEYLLEARDVEGRIHGACVSSDSLGKGFGNCEYNWGFAI